METAIPGKPLTHTLLSGVSTLIRANNAKVAGLTRWFPGQRTCRQARQSESESPVPYGGRKEPTPTRCPPIDTHMLCPCVLVYTINHQSINNQFSRLKKIKKWVALKVEGSGGNPTPH